MHLSTYLPLALLAGLAAPFAAQATGAASEPLGTVSKQTPEAFGRNILVLVADDLGVDAVGAYEEGNDLPPTPNIDRMAETGVLFRNAWSQPSCSPTRATLQTGLRGYRSGIGTVIPTGSNGFDLDLDLITLPEMLDLGTGGAYAHAAIGKWHLASQQTGELGPNLAGYSHFAGTLGGELGDYFLFDKTVDGASLPVLAYATTVVVDDALAWIGQQTKPWLCFVAFQAPHTPFHRPPDHLHTQDLPAGEPRSNCNDPSGLEPRPFFKAMVEALDTEIGRLIKGLPDAVLKDTTIVFLGDNGSDYCLGVPPFDGPAKSTLYEGGINVPLIVSGAHVHEAGESQALVQTTDLFATVAELAGVDLAKTLPGERFDSVSLVPYLYAPNLRTKRKTMLAEIFNPNGTDDFKLLPCQPDACQEDIGYGSPSGPRFSSCGPPLFGIYTDHVVPLTVTGAPPNARATLRIGSLQPGFDATLGVEVASLFPDAFVEFATDAAGNLEAQLYTGGLSAKDHYQFVFEDPSSQTGFSASNALRLELHDTRMFAVRDERFKLIHYSNCHRELYDLWNDPFERRNLLPLR